MAAVGTAAPAAVSMDELTKESTNQRHIPESLFIENVEVMVGSRDATKIVTALQDLLSKYQYMLSSLASQKSSLTTKQPEIKGSLEMVQQLKKKRDDNERNIQVDYQLADNVYSKAEIPLESDRICLWLGANVLLEYTFDEAIELLTTNLSNATKTLANLQEDLLFIRDQVTTTEVNIARVHNYGVKQRQGVKENAEGGQ